MLKGDSNTGFFHRTANGKKRKNFIFRMLDGDREITNEKDILDHATSYYKDLFGKSDLNSFELDDSLWP